MILNNFISMKNFLFLICVFPLILHAQNLQQFNERKNKIDKNLMLGLGSWATLNFIGSGIGWATAQQEEIKSFHQMNVLWNTINIGLAIPGYLKAKKNNTDLTLSESLSNQHKTEKIFLFNTGLDFAYITSGFLLRSMANDYPNRHDQFNGFGSSLILQGSFLMIFDLTAFLIHMKHANKTINKKLKNIQLSTAGLGVKWSFN
jgi:hypothetical protein